MVFHDKKLVKTLKLKNHIFYIFFFQKKRVLVVDSRYHHGLCSKKIMCCEKNDFNKAKGERSATF